MDDRYAKKTGLGQKLNTLVLLLAILVIVFCIFTFLHLSFKLTSNDRAGADLSYYTGVFHWFEMPSNLDSFWGRPWTVFTYMFMHDEVFHLIGNLIWLWVFGYILQDLAGNAKLFPVYLYGGVAGAIADPDGVVTESLPHDVAPAKSQQINRQVGARLVRLGCRLLRESRLGGALGRGRRWNNRRRLSLRRRRLTLPRPQARNRTPSSSTAPSRKNGAAR